MLSTAESAKRCFKKIMKGETDFNHWEIKWDDKAKTSPPNPPSLYYLAQIQPANWKAMGDAIFGNEFADKATELVAQYPDDSRRQQFEMWNLALKEGRLKSWRQVETAIDKSRNALNQIPRARHKVLISDCYSEALKSSMPWLKERENFYKQWTEISSLLKKQEGWKDLEVNKNNGTPNIKELHPGRSWLFALLMMSNTTITTTQDTANLKPDNSYCYQSIKDATFDNTYNKSWIIFYIAAHVSGQLPRFQIAKCPMISQYIDNYGHMQVKPIDFANPNTLLYSLFEAANDFISRIIDSLKNTADSNTVIEPASENEKISLSSPSWLPQAPADDEFCTICMEEPLAKIALIPCGHISICKECNNCIFR